MQQLFSSFQQDWPFSIPVSKSKHISILYLTMWLEGWENKVSDEQLWWTITEIQQVTIPPAHTKYRMTATLDDDNDGTMDDSWFGFCGFMGVRSELHSSFGVTGEGDTTQN